MGDRRVSIYEAINATLKEVFVGMTSEGMHKVLTRHRTKGPPEIAHWQPEHEISHRSVQPNMAPSHAADFVAEHAKALALERPGWTILTGSDKHRRWTHASQELPPE